MESSDAPPKNLTTPEEAKKDDEATSSGVVDKIRIPKGTHFLISLLAVATSCRTVLLVFLDFLRIYPTQLSFIIDNLQCYFRIAVAI